MAAHPPESPTPIARVNSVLDVLGREIVTGVMKEGQKFTLADITKRFEISRTVAREAMRALEYRGLVSSGRRVGLTVSPRESWAMFDSLIIRWRLEHDKSRPDQLRSLNQLRFAIEPMAAGLAATHATGTEKAELVRLAHRLEELERHPSHRVGEELTVDLEFHSRILMASHNEMFISLSPALLTILKGKSVYGSPKRNPIGGTAQLHIEVAEAIRDGNAAKAEEVSRTILLRARSDSAALYY